MTWVNATGSRRPDDEIRAVRPYRPPREADREIGEKAAENTYPERSTDLFHQAPSVSNPVSPLALAGRRAGLLWGPWLRKFRRSLFLALAGIFRHACYFPPSANC